MSAALAVTLGLAAPAAAADSNAAPVINTAATKTPTTGNVLLAWKPVQGAQRYRVEVRVDRNTTGTPLLTADTTALSWAPTETLGATKTGLETYYWRVGAVNSAGTVTWGNFSEFPRGPVALQGTGYFPTGQIDYPDETVSFRWPGITGAKGYRFEYTTEDSFRDDANSVITEYVTTNAYTPTFALNRVDGGGAPVLHRWRVTPLNGSGKTASAIGPPSNAQTFTYVWSDSAPRLTFPADQTLLNYPSFSWDAVEGAKYYKIELRRTTGGGVAIPSANVSGTDYTPVGQITAGSYYWSVLPFDANGQAGTRSVERQFAIRYGENLEQVSTGAIAKPTARVSPTGIDWTKAEDEPLEVKLSDLSFAWNAVPRASFYEVQVTTGNGIFVSDGSRSCITAATDVTPTFGTGVHTGDAMSGEQIKLLGNNCLVFHQDPTNAQNFQVGNTYAWRVIGYDGNATSTLAPKAGETESARSLFSAEYRFTVVSEDGPLASDYNLRIKNETGTGMGAALIASPSPLLTWDRVSDHPITRVTYRLAEAANSGLVATTYVYGATSVRLNAIFNDVTTFEPYRVVLAPCGIESNKITCSTSEYDSELIPDEKGRFGKLAPALDFDAETVKAQYSTDNFNVAWEDYNAENSAYGGSRGYLVTIHRENNLNGAPVLSQKVETNSWQYAQGIAANKTNMKLEYGVQYRLRVAVLDGIGNAGTANSGFAFSLADPTPPAAKTTVGATGVTFEWDETAAATLYGVSYALQTGGNWINVGFASNKPALSQRSVTINLPPAGTYKWRIHTLDRNDALSVVDQSESFTVAVKANTPSLTTANKIALHPSDRTLKWNTVEGASSYNVYVGSNPANLRTDINTVQTQLVPIGTAKTWSTSNDFKFNQAYYWRVDALNSAGIVIGQSEVREFSALTVPATPSLGTLKVNGTSITASIGLLNIDQQGSVNDSKFGYELEYRQALDTNGSWTRIQKTATSAAEITVSALNRATAYDFRVRAVNSVGTSEWSKERRATTIDVPSAPTLRSAKATVDSITLSWSAPSGTNKATSYKVRYRPSTTTAWTTKTSTSTSLTLTGLKNGTTYYYEIVAVNAVGDGPASAGSVKTTVPPKVPSAPTGLTAKAATGKVTLAWKAPAAGTAKITRYTIQSRQYDSKKKKWSAWRSAGTSTGTTFTASKLTNGTKYEFRVAATSSVGTGAYSAAKTVTPVGKPTAPKVTVSSKKKKQITVNWSGAKANGSKITSYRVQVSTNGKKWTTVKKAKASAKSFTWKKAKAGTKYQVRVVTYNKKGNVTSAKKTVTVKK